MNVKHLPICDYMKRESFKNIILLILTLLSMWAIIAIQFHLIPVVSISKSEDTVNSLNTFFLILAYSYIAALVFYLVTVELPSRRRKDILRPIIKRKINGIGRCISDILLEFSRKTDYGHDVHNIENTESIMKSKNWFAIVPMIKKYRNIPISYLHYMQRCGENMKRQISDLITKYHTDMTASQLVELEKLSDASFFNTIDFICSIPDSSIADTGYKSLINDFINLQEQYIKVEKEFKIH